MTRWMTVLAGTALVMTVAGCTSTTPQTGARDQPTAGSYGSETSRYGAAPTISPNDPAYAENGAPRASQPSGQNTAGATSPTGNYAPVQHEGPHGGSSFIR